MCECEDDIIGDGEDGVRVLAWVFECGSGQGVGEGVADRDARPRHPNPFTHRKATLRTRIRKFNDS